MSAAALIAHVLERVQVRQSPPWFQALVWMELLVQMPLTVALLVGYAKRAKWLRNLALLYAMHVLTTLPPIFMHIEHSMKAPHKYCIQAIYAPWVVMPALMLLRFSFGAPAARRRASTSGQAISASKKAL